MKRALRFAIACVVLTAAVAGCGLIVGLQDRELGATADAGGSDASNDTTLDAGLESATAPDAAGLDAPDSSASDAGWDVDDVFSGGD